MERRILVVDDEEMMRDAVSSFLEKKGCKVFRAETGAQALELFKQEKIDFVLLDLMLPDISGEEICIRIRQSSKVPIIMLTAKSLEADLLHGLHIGADDYMTKPFSLKELYARMEAVFRRLEGKNPQFPEQFSWNHGDLIVEPEQMRVKKAGKVVTLTPLEWKIFAALVKNPQKIFTRDELIEVAFDIGFDGYNRVIDTHIKNLRKKLEDDPKNPCYIRTAHGFGYRFGGNKD